MHTRWTVVVIGIGLLGMSLSAAEENPPIAYAVLPGSLKSSTDRQAVNAPAHATMLVDHLARLYTTPKAIAAFLKRDFRFQRDEELFGEMDRWQTPEEFVVRRAGDCEDYALLAQALLRRNGIEAYVLSLFGEEGYAHTVTVFVDEDGRYNAINQSRLRNYRAASLEALASQLYPTWTYGGIAEQDGTRGRMVREISRDHGARRPPP